MGKYKFVMNPHTDRLQKVLNDEELIFGGHFTILPFSYDSMGQGNWEYVYEQYGYTEGLIYNSSNTDGDNISYIVSLPKGTYTFILFGKTHPAYGIVDIDINDTEVASFDLYGTNTDNVRQVETGIEITESGVKTLKLRVDGKNPSASNYFCAFHYLAMIKTV